MKIKYCPVLFITTLTLCIFLLPSLVFSGENYKSFLENARNLDKDKFYEDAVSYWKKTIDANPPPNITRKPNGPPILLPVLILPNNRNHCSLCR